MTKKLSILITGMPGTGKSSVAKLLYSKIGAVLVDINKLVDVLKLYSSIDETDGAKVVRLKELQEELVKTIKAEDSAVIVEGHLGCEIKLPVSKVIVLRCNPKELRRRLSGRNYSQEKVANNALSEALDYCTVLSEKNYGKRKVWEIDTTNRSIKEVVLEVKKIIEGNKLKKEQVSFPEALMKEAIAGETIRKLREKL